MKKVLITGGAGFIGHALSKIDWDGRLKII